MTDEDIIAILVKARERFRQLVRVYQRERISQAAVTGGVAFPHVSIFKEAEQILTVAMTMLHTLPSKPSHSCVSPENKAYADQLLKEIGDLVQNAMLMDRELRKTAPVPPIPEPANTQAPLPSVTARNRALRHYATV